jgi:hypothetical protein
VLFAVVLLVLVAGAVVGVRQLLPKAKQPVTYPHCTFGTQDGPAEITPDQASVAATLVGVVTTKGLPDQAAFLLLMAAWQESGLRNIPPGAGDLDSVGVLQQRPSQGWGSKTQLSDLHYAAAKFLAALLTHDGWQSMDPAHAIQLVQVSADEAAYNQHKSQAAGLSQALLGRTPAALTCQFDPPTLVATPAAVITLLTTDLPVNPPSSSGRQISVPGAGWQTTAWFIANADRLGIDVVSYDGKRWTRATQWQADATATKTAVVATLATGPMS